MDKAQTDAVRSLWIQTVQNIPQECRDQWHEMICALERYQIFFLWLNSFFYKQQGNVQKLLREFSENKGDFEGIKEIQAFVDEWNPEKMFDCPHMFDANFTNLQRIISMCPTPATPKLSKANIAALAWTRVYMVFVNKFDLSIKSLIGSNLYYNRDISDSPNSIKTKAARFMQLLRSYLNFYKNFELSPLEPVKMDSLIDKLEKNLTVIGGKGNFYNKNPRAGYRENIMTLPKSQSPSDFQEIMAPWTSFSVLQTLPPFHGRICARVVIGSAGDIFTTIHQNLLYTLYHSTQKILENTPFQFNTNLKEVKDILEKKIDRTINLISIQEVDHKLELMYHVPMTVHSASIALKELKDGNISLKLDFVGPSKGANGGRWGRIAAQVQTATYNDQGFSTQFEITKNNALSILKTIKKLMEMTD